MPLDKKRVAFVDGNFEWRNLMESTLYDYIFRKFDSLQEAKDIPTSELERFDIIISERTFYETDDGLIWLEDLQRAGHKVLLFSSKIDEQHSVPILCKKDASMQRIRAMIDYMTNQ